MNTTEVDGVPVFWSDEPGPMRGCLVFRTGTADEPLVHAGRTHLVEHLAFTPLGVKPHAFNASVGLTTTRFATSGRPDEVATFLTTICAALGDLPTERLDIERRVLAAEATGRGLGDGDRLLLHLYGRDGYGSGNRDEWGLHAATPEAVRQHAAARFTTGAAALWLSGPPPADLSLRLPPGDAAPLPDPADRFVPPGPHHVIADVSGAALALTVRGRFDLTMFLAVLRDRLVERLRMAEGISYSPALARLRLRDDWSHVTVVADSTEADHAAAAHGLLDVLASVAAGDVTEAELAAALEALPDEDDPELRLERLDAAAMASLLGLPPPSGHLAADLAAVTPDAVAAVATAAAADLLLAVRHRDAVPPGAGDALPAWSPGLPAGAVRYRGDSERRRSRLVVADDAIGLHLGPDMFVTVPWRDVSGVLTWDDGTREILGADGTYLRVDPRDYPPYESLPALVDSLAGPAVLAPQGARPVAADADSAPADDDEQARWEREFTERHGRGSRFGVTTRTQLAALVVCVVIFAVLGCWLLVTLAGAEALRFAIPLLSGFFYVLWNDRRKERKG